MTTPQARRAAWLEYGPAESEQYDQAEADPQFPWGQQNLPGGFRIGDHVGLRYSDHEEYIFDNPTGFVVAVDDEDEPPVITVRVEATITSDRVFLIAREKESWIRSAK